MPPAPVSINHQERLFHNGGLASPPPPCGSMAPTMRASLLALTIFSSLLPTSAGNLAAGAALVAEGLRMKRMEAAGRQQTSSSGMVARSLAIRRLLQPLSTFALLPAGTIMCRGAQSGAQETTLVGAPALDPAAGCLPAAVSPGSIQQEHLLSPPSSCCPLLPSGELVSPSNAGAAGAGRRCQDLRVAPQISFPAQSGPRASCCLSTNWHTPIPWLIYKPSITL